MGRLGLSKYFEWLKIGIKIQIFDRGIILENIFSLISQIFLSYFLWKGIYGGRDILNGRTFSQMINYIVLSVGISNIFIYPNIYFMSIDIRSGNIAYTLLKPLDYQMQFLFKNIGIIIPMSMISLFSVLLFRIFVLPLDGPVNFVYFIISIFLSALTVITFDFVLGVICFWTENSWGINTFKFTIISFFSGKLIPLDFFPEYLKYISINILPFSGIIFTPIDIYQNYWSINYFLMYLIRQAGWIVLFILLGRYLFNLARKQVFINGG
ncbi:ABC transporter permease [Tepidimicrobium xylanilyticum]|uniref:ABC-2 type transport system permease protein n=1 Tax=Tepidimicrobium xylanilyticum TaxID=1123352 RepID=A0A1H2UZN6_9FIRM|nr:ABC-2 type transport system permease protein [Tepidimicrobium xylanilyticum]